MTTPDECHGDASKLRRRFTNRIAIVQSQSSLKRTKELNAVQHLSCDKLNEPIFGYRLSIAMTQNDMESTNGTIQQCGEAYGEY